MFWLALEQLSLSLPAPGPCTWSLHLVCILLNTVLWYVIHLGTPPLICKVMNSSSVNGEFNIAHVPQSLNYWERYNYIATNQSHRIHPRDTIPPTKARGATHVTQFHQSESKDPPRDTILPIILLQHALPTNNITRLLTHCCNTTTAPYCRTYNDNHTKPSTCVGHVTNNMVTWPSHVHIGYRYF